MLTEEDLNNLNYDVYNVDKEKHAKDDRPKPVKGKEYQLRNRVKVHVVDMKDDNKTGFQGMAVAPIVNGKPDYSQITVVAAGTDPSQANDLWSAPNNGKAPFQGKGQLGVAEDFVKEVNRVDGHTVTQLSGYSQSAYMLEVGGKLGIPTTVFNGWFIYNNLSPEAQKFIKANPHLFVNYRHTKDMTTFLNDFNSDWYTGEDFGTIVWIEGDSHNIRGWKFDKEGKLITDGSVEEKSEVKMSQIQNQAALAMFSLSVLKRKLKASGGGLSKNEAIYLDNSQALITVNTASQTMKTGLAEVIKLYQDAITEAEETWTEGLERARAIGTDLSEGEILEALESFGATKASVVTEPTAFYEGKIAKAKQLGESFDRLAEEIKAGIETLVQSDQALAEQLG